MMGARFIGYRRLIIGTGCVINENCVFGNRGGIQIGDGVCLAPQVYLQSGDHDVNSIDFNVRYASVIIENYCFIGVRATILKGVVLENGSVICAGAVVTKRVGSHEIWGGVPAKKIGERSSNLHYDLEWKPLFH